nr:uncharacterized protein LOC129453655 [Misgurnus anguillicaudatus]
MELRDSTDRTVADANARVETGRKWRAKEEVQKVIGRLQHQQIVGMVQTGQAGLGWSEPPILWSKASRKERKDLVVVEVTRIEQEELRVRSVTQGQQGRWTTWEGIASLIRATYDTLPCPKNLHQWLGTEQSCDLCGTINASLQHVLSGCKTALIQGRLRWRHNQVLRKLAEVLEKCWQEANQQSPTQSRSRIHFLRQGESARHTSGVEDGSRSGKASPFPTGDMQHQIKTRCGAVVCSCKVSDTDRADSAMGGGTGSCI